MNATLPIVNSSPEPSGDNARGRELLFDFFVDARAGKTRSYANGVFHGLGVRTAVANHANAADPQQRRAAILRVIDRLPQALQGAARKEKSNLRGQRALDGLLQQSENLYGKTLADFQGDIADESVTHDHVHVSREKISAFDIADKMHRELFQARVYLAREFIALDFFLADGQQADARAAVAECRPVIDFAHDRELHQMLRLGIDVGADIEQHGDAALGIRERRSERDAIDGFQSPEQKSCHRHHSSGIASADQAVGLGFAYQASRNMN